MPESNSPTTGGARRTGRTGRIVGGAALVAVAAAAAYPVPLRRWWRLVMRAALEPGSLVMERKMLLGIRSRAQEWQGTAPAGRTPAPLP